MSICLQECSVPVLQLGIELVISQTETGFVELRPSAKQGMAFWTPSRPTILVPQLCITHDLWDASGEAKMCLPAPQGGPEQQRARKPKRLGSTKPMVQKVSLSQETIHCHSRPGIPTGGTFPRGRDSLGPSLELSVRLISGVASPTVTHFACLQPVKAVAAPSSAKLKFGDVGRLSNSPVRRRKKSTAGALATHSRLLRCRGSALRSRCGLQWVHTVVDFVAVTLVQGLRPLQLGACPATLRRETSSDQSQTTRQVALALPLLGEGASMSAAACLYCSLPPTFQLVGHCHAAMTVWGNQCRPSLKLSLRLIAGVVSPTLKQFAR